MKEIYLLRYRIGHQYRPEQLVHHNLNCYPRRSTEIRTISLTIFFHFKRYLNFISCLQNKVTTFIITSSFFWVFFNVCFYVFRNTLRSGRRKRPVRNYSLRHCTSRIVFRKKDQNKYIPLQRQHQDRQPPPPGKLYSKTGR